MRDPDLNPENALVPARAAELSSLEDRARRYVAQAEADNTRIAYAADWKHFGAWCLAHQVPSLPASPATVALYITDLAAGHKPSTIRRHLTTISRNHAAAGHASPATLEHSVVGKAFRGICREKGTEQNGKQPLYTKQLRRMIENLPAPSDEMSERQQRTLLLQGKRDRALLILGFAGGFRRGELAKLTFADITHEKDGLVVYLRKSKTDQMGAGRKVALPYGSHPATCPVRAYQDWLAESNIEAGPVFRNIDRHGNLAASALSGAAIALIVKRASARIGLDIGQYSGHSLRAGLVTQSYLNGADTRSIMQQTGHKSIATVYRYIRDASLFRDNAGAKLGL